MTCLVFISSRRSQYLNLSSICPLNAAVLQRGDVWCLGCWNEAGLLSWLCLGPAARTGVVQLTSASPRFPPSSSCPFVCLISQGCLSLIADTDPLSATKKQTVALAARGLLGHVCVVGTLLKTGRDTVQEHVKAGWVPVCFWPVYSPEGHLDCEEQ